LMGHQTALMSGGPPPIALNLPEVFAEAEATGTALEVNGALPRLDCSVEVLRQARANRVHFLLTSDAHHSRELALLDFAALNAERAWLDPARVPNCWPAEGLRAWLSAGKVGVGA
jgi:DNA polymerase (family 10)